MNANSVGVYIAVRPTVGYSRGRCRKRQSGAEIPSAQQIENRLFGQQLAMISKRYLRDLRNSATIETR